MADTSLRDRAWYPPLAGVVCGVVALVTALTFHVYTWPLASLAGLVILAVGWWTESLRRDRRLRGLDEREMGLN